MPKPKGAGVHLHMSVPGGIYHNKAIADGPVGQVLAGPIFSSLK